MLVKGQEEPEENDEEAEAEASDDEKTEVKTFKAEGKNLLANEYVKRWVGDGYVIRSLTCGFISQRSPGHKHHLEVSVGFGIGNKFISEISNAWIQGDGEAQKVKISLSKQDKESFLAPVNDTAFDIYEKLRAAGQECDGAT